jgi:hypothetical protein
MRKITKTWQDIRCRHRVSSTILLKKRWDCNRNLRYVYQAGLSLEVVLECCHFVAMSDESASFHVLVVTVTFISACSVVIRGTAESIRPPAPTRPALTQQAADFPSNSSIRQWINVPVLEIICIRTCNRTTLIISFKPDIIWNFQSQFSIIINAKIGQWWER